MKKIILIGFVFLLLTSFTYAVDDLDDGLLSYWALEEGSTPWTDELSLNNLITGSTRGTDTGINNNANDFEFSNNDYIDTLDTNDYELTSFTLNFWIKRESNADYQTPFSYYYNDGGDLYGLRAFLYIGTHGTKPDKIAFFLGNGDATTEDYYSATSLNLATWYMVTFTYNETSEDGAIYINGNYDAGKSAETGSIHYKANNHRLSFGSNWDGSSRSLYFDGLIDEIGYWNRALSPTEIEEELYNLGAGTFYPFTPAGVPPFTIDLVHPTNETSFYGDYNGSIIVRLNDVNGSASCTISDNRWSFESNDNETYRFLNNTEIIDSNISINVDCIDTGGAVDNVSFWFYLDTILEIFVYDEVTESLLNISTYLSIVSDSFSQNYTIIGNSSVSSITPENYTLIYSSVGYDQRIYYIDVQAGKKTTAYLYLLNSTLSDLIFPLVIDQFSDPVVGAYVKLQRHYISTNSYKTISMTKTNPEGKGLLYVDLYDVDYKILIEYEGELVKTETPTPFIDTNPEYVVNLGDSLLESWALYDNVYANVSFLNQTGTIYARFIFDDVTNNVREGCLKVIRQTTSETETICNNCTESSSATLTCIINTSQEGIYKANGFIDTDTENSWYDLDLAYYEVDLVPDFDFGKDGILYAGTMIATLSLLALSTITGSFIMLIVGFIAVAVVGLVQGITMGSVTILIVLLFTILFIIRKGME